MADRRAVLQALVEKFDPENPDVVDELGGESWALIQRNGQRAPKEKWVALFDTSNDALAYAAADEEWAPEQLVALHNGIAWELGTRIVRTKKLRARYG